MGAAHRSKSNMQQASHNSPAESWYEKSAIRRARKGQVDFKSGVEERCSCSGSYTIFMEVPQPNPSRVGTGDGLGSGSRRMHEHTVEV